MKRNYKINVAVATDAKDRDILLQRMLVAAGFANINSDAKKIISSTINDVDLDNCFFVAVRNYNFSSSAYITQKLIRLAISGVPIFIGATGKNINNHILQFCDICDRMI